MKKKSRNKIGKMGHQKKKQEGLKGVGLREAEGWEEGN